MEQSSDEQFVWPWMGILVNVPTKFKDGRYVGESGNRLKEQLSCFNPLKVIPLWNYKGHTGNAIVDFSKDWNGFKDAMAFENHFEAEQYGKKHWKERQSQGAEIYGWVARADDYTSPGPIGDHLRKNGDLKTFSDLVNEESRKTDKLVANLASQIEVKNKHLQELESKYSENTVSIDKMMDQRDQLLQAYNEEIQKMERLAHDHSRRIFEENKKLRAELESKKIEVDERCEQLDKLVAANDIDQKKLETEKQKNAMKNNFLELATREQQKADENVLRLIEEHKGEKETALKKMLRLEQQLEAKQKLQLEIQQLKGKLQVMNHMGGEGDSAVKRKMDEMSELLSEKIEEMEDMETMNQALVTTEHKSNVELLSEKIEEMEDMETMNQALVTTEHKSNVELQEAMEEIVSFTDMLDGCMSIGIKRMGELDEKPFLNACRLKFSKDEAKFQSGMLLAKWQAELKNPDWRPYTVIIIDGKEKEVIDEEDEKLQNLKEEWGQEVYKAVATALLEIKEYNLSGISVVSEVWNYEEGRRATLKEAMQAILKQWKKSHNKRRR